MKPETKYSGPRDERHAWTHKETHPLILNLMLVREFGEEFMGWEPTTLWTEVRREWSNVSPSEVSRNKVQAVRTLYTTDQAWERWEIFDVVAAGLLGIPPKFDLIQRPPPHRAAFCVDVMRNSRPDVNLSTEVEKYIAASLIDHGLVFAPPPIDSCNKHLINFSMKGQQSRVRDAVKKNKSPTFDGTNPDDVQVMKSMSVRDYVADANDALLSQMRHVLKQEN